MLTKKAAEAAFLFAFVLDQAIIFAASVTPAR
jgi:hypothetical protein